MESLFTKWGYIVAGRVTKWITLIVWVLAAALLSAIGPNLNQQENNNAATLPSSAQSVQAEKRIKQSFPNENRDTAIVESPTHQQGLYVIIRIYMCLWSGVLQVFQKGVTSS